MSHLLNKCPICGDEIVLTEFLQYYKETKLKKNGELYKKSSPKQYCGGEGDIFVCKNCSFTTDVNFEGEGIYSNIKITCDGNRYYWEDINE